MEDYLGFAHGASAGMAATTVWEGLRQVLEGPMLFVIGILLSWVIVHGVHMHHKHQHRHRLYVARRAATYRRRSLS